MGRRSRNEGDLDERGTLIVSMNERLSGFAFALLAGYSYPDRGRGPAR